MRGLVVYILHGSVASAVSSVGSCNWVALVELNGGIDTMVLHCIELHAFVV
jgi:hypothetical protein